MKKLVSLALCLLMALSLFACTSQPAAGGQPDAAGAVPPDGSQPDAAQSQPGGETEPDADKPYAGVTLRVILATHDWTSAIEPKLAEFEEATGMKVEFEVYPENQLSDKLNVELGSGGQYIDAFMCRPLQEVQQFIQNGYLAEVGDLLAQPDFQKDDIIAAALNGYAYNGADDGKFYGVPLVTERQVLFYRKDLFQKAGIAVPTNLDELMEAAQRLNGIEPGVVGFTGRGKANPAVTQFSTYLYAFGGDFIDFSTNTATINTPEAVQAFAYYGKLLRECGPASSTNMHWNECAALYSTGGAAMCTDADAIWQSFCGPETEVYENAGFAVSPTNATWSICSWGLGISANSPNREAAMEFVKWAAGVEMTKYTQTAGISSARNSAWADPDCTANYPEELLAAIQKGNEIATKAYDRPMTTSVAQARDIIGTVITTAIEGGDVQAAADRANAEFQAILDADLAARNG
ncbi:MAG: sugar ABC transporter substrate-binding protein [bacterium]|nr:sugar ABC transporter substrate-binding protein [bacterium]